MLARTDVAKRGNGLFTCTNAVPLTQGAWTRRPGTIYLHNTKIHSSAARLFPFQFSVTQTYILEFGHLYIRFFTQHGILTATGQAITTVTKTNPAVLTYVGSDTYANGDRVLIVDQTGMSQINNREFAVANVSAGANTFELTDPDGNNVNATAYDTSTSSGTINEIIEVATPYSAADTADIRVVQSADVLYIFHPNFAPRKLVRVSATSWTLSTLAFTDGPYDVVNTTSTTLDAGVATGTTSLVASSTVGINNDAGFAATDVGRLIRYKDAANPWGYMEIVTFGTTTSVDVTIASTLTGNAATTNWRLGVWSGTTGYPTTGTFFEDRLWMGGASSFPQRVDGSRTGRYQNFAPSSVDGTVAASDGVAFTLNSNDVNRIKWLMDDEKGLVVGTARGEWLLRGSTLGEALSPTNISGKPSTKYGSADVAPQRAGKAILFVQRAGRKLRELAYVFEKDGFSAPDMSVLAEHITSPEMIEMAFQEQPQAVVWIPRSDGVLLGFTYERDQDVVGWHTHELGGFSDSTQLAIPVVESVASVPSPDATRDELYMIVQRYVNGRVRRYIEYLNKTWESGDNQLDAVYLDAAWTEVSARAEYLDITLGAVFTTSTPDRASLDIVGDIDIQMNVAMDDWTPAAEQTLVSKYGAAGQRSWLLNVTTGGLLKLINSADGTATITRSSTVAVGGVDLAAKWVRATLDVDNGATGNTATFYTSTDGATWSALGAPVTTAATTSIFASTALLRVGPNENAAQWFGGNVYRVRLYNGIAGTLVSDFNAQDADIGWLTWNSSGVTEVWTTVTTASTFAGGPIPKTVVTGLFHLEGEEVGVYVDGAVRPNETITNGKMTLGSAGSIITLGYAYNSDGMTMPIEAGSQDGSAQTKTKRIVRVGFWLLDTLGLQYGPDFDNLTEIIFRSWGDTTGEATPLFTGALRERFEGDYDKLGQIAWRCSGPFPATVLGIAPQVNLSDDT